MKKIAVHGFYGYGNLGDEAILRALLQEIYKNYNYVEVIVFSSNPKCVSKVHGVKCYPERGMLSILRRLYEIGSSKLFVLGGGGLLKDYGEDSSNIKRWLSLLNLAQKLGTKTATYAIGVENIIYNDSIKMLRNTLERVDLITVRDKLSENLIKKIGVENQVIVTSDPAVLLAGRNTRRRNLKEPPRIMVCLRHWFSKGFYIENSNANENFMRILGKALDYIVDNYKGIIDFVPLRTISYDDDRIVAKQVISYMNNRDKCNIFNHAIDLDNFIKLLDQRYSIVIGMRLHSLILSTALGIPAIGLEYSPKVRAYMESINQDKYSLDLKNLNYDELIKIIDSVFLKYSTISKSICSSISTLKRKAYRNIEMLIGLL